MDSSAPCCFQMALYSSLSSSGYCRSLSRICSYVPVVVSPSKACQNNAYPEKNTRGLPLDFVNDQSTIVAWILHLFKVLKVIMEIIINVDLGIRGVKILKPKHWVIAVNLAQGGLWATCNADFS